MSRNTSVALAVQAGRLLLPNATVLASSGQRGLCTLALRLASSFSAGRLNHVAIAVPNLSKAASLYKDVLGAKVSEPQALPDHGVTVVFVDLPNTRLELLEPLGSQSPVSAFLEKNKAGGVHHICLEVDDIGAATEHVASHGVRLLGSQPKVGAHGVPVVFAHPKDMAGVLVELEESRRGVAAGQQQHGAPP